jgi:predicted site-specific integrase-resolvase
MNNMDKMYSIRRTSKILGLSTNTLRNWAKGKKIKAVKIPSNSEKAQWFIPESEIERLQKGEDNNE